MTADPTPGRLAFSIAFKEANSDVHTRSYTAKSADDAVGMAVEYLCDQCGLMTDKHEPDIERFNSMFTLVSARCESPDKSKVGAADWEAFKKKWQLAPEFRERSK